MDRHYSFVSSPADHGTRLDQFLQLKLAPLSRSRIKQLIQEDCVKLAGKTTKASQILKGKEEISVIVPAPEPLDLEPKDIPLSIIYEDEHLLAIDKAAEWVVHPGAGAKQDTLVHALLHHCQDLSGIGGKLRPGIVHRLDKGTSGLLLIAKNDPCHQALSEAFKNREVQKTYFALIWGKPSSPTGKFSSPLGRDPKDRKKMSSRSTRARSALTRYTLKKNWGAISLVEIHPETGRTHQIRVHFAEAGHPILGDPCYGKGSRRLDSLGPQWRQRIQRLPFQLLHAGALRLKHPMTQKELDLKAELRPEMKAIIQDLEQSGGPKS
jgi:23S rRNA pseudouridine1911/1915/1917 synthase